jgi:predicted transcriptional regulator
MPSIYVKNGEIQFWGSPRNPTPVGIAFEADCCPCGCWFVFDDFNDEDTTHPPGWYEVKGNWGIVGYQLIEDCGF